MNELETLPEEPKNEQQPPKSIRDQLKEWGFDLDVFEDRAKKARGEAKEEYGDVMDKVRDGLAKAKVQLSEVAKASKPAGAELKVGFEKAWSEIVTAVKRAEEKVAEQKKDGGEPPPSDPS
jgi:outer membrane lipopolysaccharide assembly protein LptE/RlpB